MKITIGEYLLKRLKELGIRHIIGVPGDYNLQFLEQIREEDGVDFVGASNELNAAYAADGYAREHGISALAVTYGVGDLGAIGGVAGAAAEKVPVVVISGAPPLFAKRHNYRVHHSLADGNFSNIDNCYEEFTCYRTTITQENAQDEIDTALRKALRHSRPVNIQLPSNITYLHIDVEDKPLAPVSHTSDPERVQKCVEAIVAEFSKAEKPAVLIDQAVDRLKVAEKITRFIDKTQTPFAAMSTGKAVLDESHPLYRGSYAGDASGEGVQAFIESADFLLTVAPRFIEGNSGNYTAHLPEDTVMLHRSHTFVGKEVFEGVGISDVLDKLIAALPASPKSEAVPKKEKPDFHIEADKKLTQADFWRQIQGFLQPDDLVYGETGTAAHGLGGLQFPPGAKFIASYIWGAIGFTLPALFGSLLANPRRRQILFIGDGSFQVTGQALSRILYEELNPIIFLINNDGYTIERYIMGMDAPYNDIPVWQYHKLPPLLTKKNRMETACVHTQGELQEVLSRIKEAEHGMLIEVKMDREDAPRTLEEFGPMAAAFNYGPRGPENPAPKHR